MPEVPSRSEETNVGDVVVVVVVVEVVVNCQETIGGEKGRDK